MHPVSPEADHPWDGSEDTRGYFIAVAHGRYVMRTVTRIVDEQAKKERLDSLEHQALIQACGALNGSIRISELAERLDIVPAFASRLVGKLEAGNLVTRSQCSEDHRVTLVRVTEEGLSVLHRINDNVKVHVGLFKSQLSEQARADAFKLLAFYVGAPAGLGGSFFD